MDSFCTWLFKPVWPAFCLGVFSCLVAYGGQPNVILRGDAADFGVEIEQITFGPKHHIFGYIGHVQNIPWNRSGRYILALRFDVQDRMPKPHESADVVLIDTQNRYRVRVVEQTRAWNLQQGTMCYWNPDDPENQFFFNDRDPDTDRVFCVLFDITQGKHGRRVREYRYDDTPFGNGGVAQNGGFFLGINYGRLARLRPVTGYPRAYDWTVGEKHPGNDGIFKVDVQSGKKELLVSFQQMRDSLTARHPDVEEKELFINHTLWNRDGDRVYFYVRGDFAIRGKRFNVPMTINADGSGLEEQRVFIGGHPEWEFGHRMIGAIDDRMVLYDMDRQRVVETVGTPAIFPKPGGDNALSPDGKWIVSGYSRKSQNTYVIYRRTDGAWIRTPSFYQPEKYRDEIRNDPSPCWNRESSKILFPSITQDEDRTRQLFLMRLQQNER